MAENISTIRSYLNTMYLDKNNPGLFKHSRDVQQKLLTILSEDADNDKIFRTLQQFLSDLWRQVCGSQWCYRVIPSEPVSLCLYKIADWLRDQYNAAPKGAAMTSFEFLIPDEEFHKKLMDSNCQFIMNLTLPQLMCSGLFSKVLVGITTKGPKVLTAANLYSHFSTTEQFMHETAKARSKWTEAESAFHILKNKQVGNKEHSFIVEYAAAYKKWDFIMQILSETDDSVLSDDLTVSVVCERAVLDGNWAAVGFILGINDRRKPDYFAVEFALKYAVEFNLLNHVHQIMSMTGDNRPRVSSIKKLYERPQSDEVKRILKAFVAAEEKPQSHHVDPRLVASDTMPVDRSNQNSAATPNRKLKWSTRRTLIKSSLFLDSSAGQNAGAVPAIAPQVGLTL